MAWEDRTTFEAIELHFGLKRAGRYQTNVMWKEMKPPSFKLWRARTIGRNTKHEVLGRDEVARFVCSS